MLAEMVRELISYLWPITKTYTSEFSKRLEVQWVNGKKVLNSPDANYSYGKLQEVLDFGLNRLQPGKAQSALILGLGAGSVLESLEQRGFKGRIKAVEIDPVVVKIAREVFNLNRFKFELLEMDAALFVAEDSDTYDLIIVDLFLNDQVPVKFRQVHFWELVCSRLSDKGQLLFNLGMWEKVYAREKELKQVFEHYGELEVEIHPKVLGKNQLLIARRSSI